MWVSDSEVIGWLWLVWLSGLSVGLWTWRLLVPFPVWAHVWVVGQIPSWGRARGKQFMFLSLSISLPSSENKSIKSFLKKRKSHFGNCPSLIKSRSPLLSKEKQAYERTFFFVFLTAFDMVIQTSCPQCFDLYGINKCKLRPQASFLPWWVSFLQASQLLVSW